MNMTIVFHIIISPTVIVNDSAVADCYNYY